MRQSETFLWFVLSASPLAVIPACCFCNPGFPGAPFFPGDPPRTSAIFCDIEATRRCATPEDQAMGVDVSRPFEDGFWVGRSGPIGLDSSPTALAECNGQPQAVVYRDAFPDGSPVCLNAATIPDVYGTTNDACKAWCYSQGWIDGDGNEYRCDNIAWRSNGADSPFPDACGESGTLRADFQDPRRVPPTVPVVWTAIVGATASGGDLTKPATEAAQWGNSGAVSMQQLATGDGTVFATASETTTFRLFGLGNGNASASFEDVEYGLLFGPGGALGVVEAGMDRGVVRYKKNGTVLYTSLVPPMYPLLVDAALYGPGPGSPSQDKTLRAVRGNF